MATKRKTTRKKVCKKTTRKTAAKKTRKSSTNVFKEA